MVYEINSNCKEVLLILIVYNVDIVMVPLYFSPIIKIFKYTTQIIVCASTFLTIITKAWSITCMSLKSTLHSGFADTFFFFCPAARNEMKKADFTILNEVQIFLET